MVRCPPYIPDDAYFAIYGKELIPAPVPEDYKKRRTITVFRPETRRALYEKKYEWCFYFFLTEDEIIEHIVKESI